MNKRLPLLLIALCHTLPAQALTMREAVEHALEHDPRVLASRSAIDAASAVLDQSAAGYRPQIGVSAVGGHMNLWSDGLFPQSGARWNNALSLNIAQVLYQGGGLDARAQAADYGLEAARQSQRDIGGQIILATLTAYADVLRDRQVRTLSEANVRTLEQAADNTRIRTQAGEATHTDEAQSQARLAEARAGLKRASAQLRVSEAGFRRVTGIEPLDLKSEWPEISLPANLQQAVQLSASAPAVLAARAQADASKRQIAITEADKLPKISLEGGANTQDNTEFGYDRLSQWLVQLKVTMPLYQGGLLDAKTAEARARAAQAQELGNDVRSVYAEAASQQWELLQATVEMIHAYEAEQRAAALALDGTHKELEAGTRTTLDLLNAERELLSAQVNLISSQRDRAVTAFRLLAACGQLEPSAIPQ